MSILDEQQRVFMTGNEVVAWAAIAAEADFMYGYPITPQNEIMAYWSRMAPKLGKGFLQTEDEMSAGFSMLGGALVGKKTFSATAGPGNVLMQEPIAMAEMMRIPGVWIIQQRGGPSTATVIYSQQETRLTALGGNGEGMRIVYSTASHQDLFDYTIKAFNSAWKYRFPTFVLGDGYQAKMREPLSVYLPKHRNIEMVKSDPTLGKPGVPTVDRDPSHIRNTYNIEEELFDVLEAYAKDYEAVIRDLTEWEQDIPGGKCDVLVVAHGIVSRAAHEAVKILSGKAIKAGYFRPITIRPFPADALKKVLSENPGCRLLVVESAYGQLASMVKENLYGLTNPIDTLLKPGVGVTSDEIVQRLERSFVG